MIILIFVAIIGVLIFANAVGMFGGGKFRMIAIILLCSFGAQAQTFPAEYIDNYDGDTFCAYVEIPTQRRFYDYEEVKVRCRLFRCDTYEMKDEENIEIAQAAKYFTQAKLSQGGWYLRYRGKDYHGRWLVTVVFDDGETLAEKLRKKGYLTGKYQRAKEGRRVY